MLRCFLFFLLNVLVLTSKAAVLPAEHAVLNHSDVYIEEELKWSGRRAELVLFVDSLYPGKKPLLLLSSALPCFRLTNLEWGKEYFWRVKYFDADGKQIGFSPMHHFYIQGIFYPNKEQMRLRVNVNDTSKHQGGFIAVDYTRSVYDRSGRAVWTIPVEDSLMDARIQVRDLRPTDNNTFTFLTGKAPIEIDYEGHIVWKAPYPLVINSDTVIYHHDFQKTNRGTYLVMGLKKEYRLMLGKYSEEQLKTADIRKVEQRYYQATQMNMMLEFDKNGKLIWSWSASPFLSDETLNYKKTVNGLPNFATHANAFGQTDNPNILYVGYRDLSRIMKVDKKTGKVLKSYGENYPGTKEKFIAADFRKQHGTFLTSHQTILLFNNNNTGPADKTISSVMELDNGDVLTGDAVLWRFSLDFDTLTAGKGVSGGNVLELKNQNVFVCAGTLNRIFEVTRKKEIVWDAFVEARRAGESWQAAPQYRANFKQKFSWHTAKVIIEVLKDKQVLQIHNTGTEEEIFELVIKKTSSKKISLKPGTFYSETLSNDFQSGTLNVRLVSTLEVLPITTLKN